MKRAVLLLFLVGCGLVFGRNVNIVNPTSKPLPIKVAGAPIAAPTPTASPGATATATATATSTPASLNDGDPVSTWVDSSGNGHSATQTGTARPTFKTNILNGKPVVRFTSAGLSGLNLVTPISGAAPWSGLVVMNQAAANNSLFSLTGNSVIPSFLIYPSPALLFWRDLDNVVWSISREDYINAGGTGIPSGWSVWLVRKSAPSFNIFWRGNGIGDPTGSAYGPTTGDFTAIGYSPGTTPVQYSNGDIAEIIVYNSFLSVPTLTNIETYLGNKYAIPVASGGTAVDPSTVPGLIGWWKADSLGP